MNTDMLVKIIPIVISIIGLVVSILSAVANLFPRKMVESNQKLLWILKEIEDHVNIEGGASKSCPAPIFPKNDEYLQYSPDVQAHLADLTEEWYKFISVLLNKPGPYGPTAPGLSGNNSYGIHLNKSWMRFEHEDIQPFKEKLNKNLAKLKEEILLENKINQSIFTFIKRIVRDFLS